MRMKINIVLPKTNIVLPLLLIGFLLAQSAMAADIESQLEALKAAYEAGILTEQEFTTKKAQLEAKLRADNPALDEATQKKLKALDTAYQAGILSEEEYNRKKAELLGGQSMGGQTSTTDTQKLGYKDPQGRFAFQPPQNWSAKDLTGGDGVQFTRGQSFMALMIFPGSDTQEATLEYITGQIRGQWQNFQEIKRGQEKVGGQPTPFLEFTGTNPKGMNAHSRVTAFAVNNTRYIFMLVSPQAGFDNDQSGWRELLDTFKLTSSAAASTSASARKGGKTFQHPLGFAFWYPQNWKVQESQMGLQLVPPDAKSNQSGPTELYFIFGEAAPGITRPDDPRVVQYFESQLLTILPFMRRTGNIEQIKTSGGDGALITWEGKNPTGMDIRAYVHVSIIKGYGIALIGLGDKNVIETRKPVLRDVFSSFGMGQSKIDTNLVGRWRYEDNYSSGEFIGINVRYMSLRQDGTFDTSGRVLASMGSNDAYGNPIGSTNADTGTSPGERGRWGTGNKKLYLMWDDGSYAEYTYYIEGAPGGRKMLLTPANGKKELWNETR